MNIKMAVDALDSLYEQARKADADGKLVIAAAAHSLVSALEDTLKRQDIWDGNISGILVEYLWGMESLCGLSNGNKLSHVLDGSPALAAVSKLRMGHVLGRHFDRPE